jgi:hypothetical protein
MVIQKNGAAPYAPASAIIDLIDRFRNHGLSTPFDQEVLIRAGVSESLAPRTLQALRLLGLINKAGDPTQEMQLLGDATSDEYQSQLEAILRAAYADVFAFANPTTDPPERIEDAFRGYTPRGQRGRMVSLFMGLCRQAGLAPAQTEREGRPRRSSTGAPKVHVPSSGTRTKRPSPQTNPKLRPPSKLPEALESLVNDLPRQADGWTPDQRQAFLDAFRAMVDVYFPAGYNGERPQLLPGPRP